MTEPLISVMLPSRGRGPRLLESLRSVYGNASNPEGIETLIKIDHDDVDSYLKITKEIEEITNGNYKLLISDRLEGYWSLHHAWNNLSSISKGEFLLLWNDDAIIGTVDWDSIVAEYKNKICIIQLFGPQIRSIWPIFPLTHRKIYEITGYLSPTAFNDSYLHDLAALAGVEVFEHRIHTIHMRSDVAKVEKDATYEEGAQTSITEGPLWKKEWDRYNIELMETIKRNAMKVAETAGTKYSSEYELEMRSRYRP